MGFEPTGHEVEVLHDAANAHGIVVIDVLLPQQLIGTEWDEHLTVAVVHAAWCQLRLRLRQPHAVHRVVPRLTA